MPGRIVPDKRWAHVSKLPQPRKIPFRPLGQTLFLLPSKQGLGCNVETHNRHRHQEHTQTELSLFWWCSALSEYPSDCLLVSGHDRECQTWKKRKRFDEGRGWVWVAHASVSCSMSWQAESRNCGFLYQLRRCKSVDGTPAELRPLQTN